MDGSTNIESTDVDTTVAGFGALADPIRLRVLALLEGGTRCVCELQDEIGVAPNLLSYHLKVLREAGLITGARRGRWIDYSLVPEALAALGAALPGRR